MAPQPQYTYATNICKCNHVIPRDSSIDSFPQAKIEGLTFSESLCDKREIEAKEGQDYLYGTAGQPADVHARPLGNQGYDSGLCQSRRN